MSENRKLIMEVPPSNLAFTVFSSDRITASVATSLSPPVSLALYGVVPNPFSDVRICREIAHAGGYGRSRGRQKPVNASRQRISTQRGN